jgi:hypothetical protein
MTEEQKQQNRKEWRNREVGCLWRRGTFLTGVLKLENLDLSSIDPLNPTLDVIAFVNKKQDLNDKKPDVVIYISKKQENPVNDLLDGDSNEVEEAKQSKESSRTTLDPQIEDEDEEEAPFD